MFLIKSNYETEPCVTSNISKQEHSALAQLTCGIHVHLVRYKNWSLKNIS